MKINPQTILFIDIPPLLEGFIYGKTYITHGTTRGFVCIGDPVTVETLLSLLDAGYVEVIVYPAS